MPTECLQPSPARMRILVLTSTFPRWHDDTEPPFVFALCARLARDYRVTVLAPHTAGARRAEHFGDIEVLRYRYCFSGWETLAYEGGILARLRQNRWRYLLVPFLIFGQLVAVTRLVRNRRFAVLHAHWLVPQGLVAAVACAMMKDPPPIVCTSHGGDLYALRGWLAERLKRFVFRRSAAITVVSRAMREYAVLHGAKPETCHVIPMGVDTHNTFTPSPEARLDGPRVLFVGRLVEKKGCRYLIDAMSAVRQRFPDVVLSIVGSGPEEVALRRQALDAGIGTSVIFHGAVRNEELSAYYGRATVVVVPSVVAVGGDQEGLGLVIVEALSCGRAVVVSDLPATRDVVTNEQTGLLVEPGDSVALAAALIRLLSNPAERTAFGLAGRAFAKEHFDWDVSSRRYGMLFEQIAESYSRGRPAAQKTQDATGSGQ